MQEALLRLEEQRRARRDEQDAAAAERGKSERQRQAEEDERRRKERQGDAHSVIGGVIAPPGIVLQVRSIYFREARASCTAQEYLCLMMCVSGDARKGSALPEEHLPYMCMMTMLPREASETLHCRNSKSNNKYRRGLCNETAIGVMNTVLIEKNRVWNMKVRRVNYGNS